MIWRGGDVFEMLDGEVRYDLGVDIVYLLLLECQRMESVLYIQKKGTEMLRMKFFANLFHVFEFYLQKIFIFRDYAVGKS